MVEVQAVSSDEIFQEWLRTADGKSLKKYFEKKNVDFKREHVSAVETVYDVSKFIVIYFEKQVPEILAAGSEAKVQTITADKLDNYKFYDFKDKRVDYDQWKEKSTEVPTFASIRKVECQKCHGTGTQRCEVCGGTSRVKCDKCDGTGKKTCSTCKGTAGLKVEIEVYNAENKKTKIERTIPCTKCAHTGAETCSKCGGGRSLLCRNCEGGTIVCKECKGFGIFYQFKYEPIPFRTQRKSAMVFYKKDVEKFIDKREVEQLLNSRDTSGITLFNVEDLVQSKLVPQLNYWTQEADKICNDAKKEFKNLLKRREVKSNQKIMVYPALQLRCKSVKGKNFELFGIGNSSNFVILSDGFK
ncbi:MAG: hypothetical protein EAX90_10770 [Candidatus Heimdallarchaeota archaeon]|nr:hypothetical protein [Candidatus Heimdallarchaeota archaeon]